jgi:hypothetical protein
LGCGRALDQLDVIRDSLSMDTGFDL